MPHRLALFRAGAMEANVRGISVYVVDDDPDVRRSMGFLLHTLKLRPRSFADGDALLSAEEGLAPGCILLDLCLPRRSGVDVQAELLRRGNPLPVVAMTGAYDSEAEEKAIAQGAISALHKPFTVEALVAALSHCVGRIEAGLPRRGGARKG